MPIAAADPIAATRAEAMRATADQAPPHRLWASLETAFPASDDGIDSTAEERLPGYLGLAITLGLSLALWAIILKLVLLH